MNKKARKSNKGRIHTNAEIAQILTDIRQLRDSNKNDNEIRDLLGIEPRQYQRLTKRICDEDQQVWYSITQQEMAGTLLRLRSSLNHSYIISKKMSEDETADISDRLEALESMNNFLVDLAKLLIEGPEMLRQVQTQLPHIETKPYEDEHEHEWRERGEQILNEE